jgi:hypothetical protein
MKLGVPFDFRNGYCNEIMLYDNTGLAIMYSEDVGKNYPIPHKDIKYETEPMIDGDYQTIGYILPTHPDKIFYIKDLYLEVRDYAHTRLHLWHVMIDYEYKE